MSWYLGEAPWLLGRTAMKIATWNVNSIRARTAPLLDWLKKASPDVLCLQELKCTDELFPSSEVAQAGYQAACYGQKTYNGVAIVSRLPITGVLRGFGDAAEDDQHRLIAATIAGVRVISLYAPNGQAVDSPAFEYKLEWYGRLRRYLDRRHRLDEPLVLTGDFNIAPEPIDVYDPPRWEGLTLFSPKERAALRHLRDFGLVDTFRIHHPEPGRFSWWDYRRADFQKNRGLRIDHLLATRPLAARCIASDIDRDVRAGPAPSDHAPVWAELAHP